MLYSLRLHVSTPIYSYAFPLFCFVVSLSWLLLQLHWRLAIVLRTKARPSWSSSLPSERGKRPTNCIHMCLCVFYYSYTSCYFPWSLLTLPFVRLSCACLSIFRLSVCLCQILVDGAVPRSIWGSLQPANRSTLNTTTTLPRYTQHYTRYTRIQYIPIHRLSISSNHSNHSNRAHHPSITFITCFGSSCDAHLVKPSLAQPMHS